VWTPTRIRCEHALCPDSAQTKLPVLLWIHGGGWLTGGAPLSWYHGDSLAMSGRVVVVSANYRLGALGNLYLPTYTAGSMALQDLISALDWVHENIGAFGGDRNAITLCGQSAGAWYATALMASSAASGRFARAILLSLPGSIKPQPSEDAALLAREYCRLLDVAPRVSALRAIPVERLLDAQLQVARRCPVFANIPETFLPIADDTLLPADMLSAAAARSVGTPVLLGTLPEEMGAFFCSDQTVINAHDMQIHARFESVYGIEGRRRYEERKTARPDASGYDHLVELVSEEIFHEPTRRLAGALAKNGNPAFLYNFTWRSNAPLMGACHCLELPFVFNNFESWLDAGMLAQLDLDVARGLARHVQESLLNFVERGDPNGGELPEWPAYSETDKSTMVFDHRATRVSK
jgi:para-nitrobenzyl esterase